MWWNSDLGQLFIWFNDGNTTQWVPASTALLAPYGVLNGTLNIYPSTASAPSTAMALNTLQYASGTVTGPTSLNNFKIFSDDVNADNTVPSDYFVEGFSFQHYFGGTNTRRGGRNALAVYAYLTGPSATNNDNWNYVALTGVATATASDGGTALTVGNMRGALFGAGIVAVAQPAATNLVHVCGLEVDVALQAGSSAGAKSGLLISSRIDDRVKGAITDAAIWIFKQDVACPTFTDGILFDWRGNSANMPFDSSSTVMRTGPGTIGVGIDFSATTVATAAFKSPGFTVGPTGGINIATGIITANTPGITIGNTWNNAATVFQGLAINIANTASAATSRIIDTFVGGVAVFSVDRSGQIRSNNIILNPGQGYFIGANQVVGVRNTGWAAMTGTANSNTVYDTASVTLAQLAGRVMSLQAALTTHGLIGP
jgi:hypothetical protein